MTTGSNRGQFLKVAGASAVACATATTRRVLDLHHDSAHAGRVPFSVAAPAGRFVRFCTRLKA